MSLSSSSALFIVLLLNPLNIPTIQLVDGFLPLTPLFSKHDHLSILYSSLQDRTVKELWECVKDAGLIERGLKTRLKKKQDIIDFLEHQEVGRKGANDENPNRNDLNGKILEEDELSYEIDDNNNIETDQKKSLPDIRPDIASKIPDFLAQNMIQKGITSLLPIQVESFQRIYEGEDVVLQAPTGAGKTLAFVLPCLARKWKGLRKKTAAPLVLVLTPSRELSRQVGKEFSKFSKAPCATVYGGVPIERHVAMLKGKPQILISTPGRLRELVREGHLDYSQIATLVLDEADSLLDTADSPDVQAIMEDMETAIGDREDPEYQLILVSATINHHVVEFAKNLEMPQSALIRVQGQESKTLMTPEGPSSSSSSLIQQGVKADKMQQKVPLVQHWHTSCKSSVRPSVLANLISVLDPQLTIVFVATKTETESLGSYLSNKLGGSIRILHGDMAQSARSRSIALIREAADKGVPQILIATDVVSRGIDLNCDLVVQFGVPRIAGKEGTFSTDLYTHRTGRTGRVRSRQQSKSVETANAILLYDPAAGEGKLIPALSSEVKRALGVEIRPKPLPSSLEVAEAGYDRVMKQIEVGENSERGNDLAMYFKSKLESEQQIDTTNPDKLLDYLSRTMAILSHLDTSCSPYKQHSSLISGNDADRTLRLYRDDGEALTPPEVTSFCKELGSGKLGRVIICKDGSALFDLPLKKAEKLIASCETSEKDWHLELPLSLPNI